jgi:hypothetical protein
MFGLPAWCPLRKRSAPVKARTLTYDFDLLFNFFFFVVLAFELGAFT